MVGTEVDLEASKHDPKHLKLSINVETVIASVQNILEDWIFMDLVVSVGDAVQRSSSGVDDLNVKEVDASTVDR